MTLKKPLLAAILATNTMLLVSSSSQPMIQANLEYLAEHADSDKLFSAAQADEDDFWPEDEDSWLAYYRPYVVKNGILQIPVQGVLLHKFPYSFGRWATGYQYIERALARGLADPDVRGIALVIDSPGGMVAGCFECADKVYAARGQKPIKAYASDSAYSAAYMLASATDSITVTRSGGVGSIGVVTAHIQYKKMLDRMGIEVTFIFRGAHKVDGNSYEKLSASAKERMQKRIDKMYSEFVGSVARNRSMDDDDVRSTEALTYDAEEGIEIGLSDKIGALDEELALFASEFHEDGEDEMSTPTQGNVTGKKPGTENNPGATLSQSDVDAARAEGVAEGRAAGASEERARISGILASDQAKNRPAAAMQVAMKTSMSLEDATAFLDGLPAESATTTPAPTGKDDDKGDKANRNHFEEHMDKTGGGPGIKPSGKNPETGEAASDSDQVSAILSDFAAASGRTPKTVN